MSNKVKVVVEIEYEWSLTDFELGNIEEDVAKHIGQGMFIDVLPALKGGDSYGAHAGTA